MTITANTRLSALQGVDAITLVSRLARKAGFGPKAFFSARDALQAFADGSRFGGMRLDQSAYILTCCATDTAIDRARVFNAAAFICNTVLEQYESPDVVFAAIHARLEKLATQLQRPALAEQTMRIFESKVANRQTGFA